MILMFIRGWIMLITQLNGARRPLKNKHLGKTKTVDNFTINVYKDGVSGFNLRCNTKFV